MLVSVHGEGVHACVCTLCVETGGESRVSFSVTLRLGFHDRASYGT